MLLSWPAVLICLGSGILAAYFQVWLFTAVLVAIAVMTGLMRPQTRRQLAAAGGVALAGIMIYVLNVPPFPADLEEQAVVKVIGRVASIPYFNGDKTVFMVETNNRSPYRQRLRVVCLFPVDFHRGDRVYLEGRLKPRPPGNPWQFDFPRYLITQGVYNLTSVDSANTHLVEAGRGPLIWMDSLRSRGRGRNPPSFAASGSGYPIGMITWAGELIWTTSSMKTSKHGHRPYFLGRVASACRVFAALYQHAGLVSRIGQPGPVVPGIAALLVYRLLVAWPPPGN